MKILITGGAGFIGSALVRYVIQNTEHEILNIDSLTYAGCLESLSSVEKNIKYKFKKIDICDYEKLEKEFLEFGPNIIIHLAAETHVDRSIDSPSQFIKTNILGTYNLLEISRSYFNKLPIEKKNLFRFHHVSTDEVYGDLSDSSDYFKETTPYAPSSPYSASKASSDHLVRAWGRTFNLPILITNCSNNYGPYQFPEKLIPHVILKALSGQNIPIYGNGKQVRDWLYVDDHAEALFLVATKGRIGETYNIGGHNEKMNLDVVEIICNELDERAPHFKRNISKFRDLIKFVEDRPGHDKRYAIDSTKIKEELGWIPRETFETGIKKTINWYVENSWWYKGALENADPVKGKL